MDADSNTAVSLDAELVQQWERQGYRACRTLRDLAAGVGDLATELQDKFFPALKDVKSLSIETLPADAGAFVVRESCLVLDERPLVKIADAVFDDYRRRRAANENVPAGEDLPSLLGQVFVDYLFHELRHRSQGVERYSQVQRLKVAAGAVAMARLDAMADRDAAFGYAAYYSAEGSRALFLERFREALFFSITYFFRVFPPCASRVDKIERANAVFLMAGRLAALDLTCDPDEDKRFPLDAPIFVSLSNTKNALAIYRSEPSQMLLQVANDEHGLSDLVSDIENGKFDSALESSIFMLGKLKMLPR